MGLTVMTKKKKAKKRNQFKALECCDHEIVDHQGTKIGELRVKPSRVLWKRKGKQTYKSVSLEKFTDWISDKKTAAQDTTK